MTAPFDTAKFYADFQGFAKLRAAASKNSPDALRSAAQQFEAVFIEMMVKSMRETQTNDGMLDSQGTRFAQEMFDKQVAVELAKKEELGLADLLVEQVQSQAPAAEEDPFVSVQAAKIAIPFEISEMSAGPFVEFDANGELKPLIQTDESRPTALVENSQIARDARATPALPVSERTAAVVDEPVPSAVEEETAVRSEDMRIRSPRDFVAKLRPYAEQAAATIGVAPDLLLAQAALESGWGRRIIKRPDGSSSFNMFGIKADRRWTGDRVYVRTTEYIRGVRTKVRAPFRAYDSYADSFNDYANFIMTQPRYRKALQQAGNSRAYMHALQRAGYATDPRYANKVLTIIARREFDDAGSAGAAETAAG